jgi:Adenylate cyclase, class 2 (thermophilic)
MPVNLELKARIELPSRMLRILRKIGTPAGTLLQTDTYFKIGKGRLKLREFSKGKSELIFYMRNEKRGRRWSEYSILTLSDAEEMKEFLRKCLGITVVVRKVRHVFYYKKVCRIHFDEVKGLGKFIEFEIIAKRDKQQAIFLYNKLVKCFGINAQNTIRCSYADLLQEKRRHRLSL